jgi:hypothetical protein
MKGSKILSSIVATMIALGMGAVLAQGQQGGGQQGGQQQMQQQQQRQAERAMSQDRVMDQDRLQTRERDRTQDREQAATKTQASKGAGDGIYGGNLMTVQERNQYRAELGGLATEQERNEYKARHRDKMQLRAKERDVEPEITTD